MEQGIWTREFLISPELCGMDGRLGVLGGLTLFQALAAEHAEQIGVGARRAGMPAGDVCGNLEVFSPLKTAEAVAKELRAGDVLLVRIGRQNAAAEIIRYLREHLEK